MIFQHKLDAVLAGTKTQTRRLAKPCDIYHSLKVVMLQWGRTKWEIGNIYAVQPGRCKKAVAYIRIINIRREDVRNISDTDVIAEGFNSREEFLALWRFMYGNIYDAWVLEFELLPRQLELIPQNETKLEPVRLD